MHGAPANGTIRRLPPEFRAVPIHPADEHIPLRLCVLMRAAPDPVAGRFLQLRSLPGARVYLGCVCDAGGRVREWIEVWLQTVAGLASSAAAHGENLANHLLDQRWATQSAAMRAWAPECFLETGWETRQPPPSLVDLTTFTVVQPANPDGGGPWDLCQDDTLLRAASLPPYSTSLNRYLYQPGAGQASRFVPAAGESVENAATVPAAQALGLSDHLVPFNLEAGLMMANTFHPLSFEDFVDLLGGKPWSGVAHGKTPLSLGEVYQHLTDWDARQATGSCLFLGAHGRAGRVVETLYLKLQLLADALRAARVCVQAHQLPFLNLSPESYRVRLAEISTRLPLLWTARCTVVQPTQALALHLKTTDQRLFVRTGQPTGSIYLPGGQIRDARGAGTIRIRTVLPHEPNALVTEGTLVPQEPIRCAARDILWLRLPLGAEFVDLYGHLSQDSLADSEVRFRTTPQQFPETAATALRSSSGSVFPHCQYEIIPLLSSPCDLYSLAVLALRTLLVNDKAALPIALDDFLGLARQVALEHKPDVPLPARLAAIFGRKSDWLESLGPHRLLAETLKPEEAVALVTAELWCDVLAALLRLMPGAGPDSYCADLGDAPPLALETVFDRPLAEFDKLLLKARSLVIVDWNFNREIRAVIEDLRHSSP
ncbi:MAG: hypothetical protein JXQ71_02860 [Verrucomicrobia bacterium]|nr:hypothetical protein [Verrucomicrobiota bacterium]